MNTLGIPFNRHLGLEISTRPGFLLMLPGGERYTNHLGSVHAGAILALAEATSGEFMLREFADLDREVWPVVRRVEAKFRKPARDSLHARASFEAGAKEMFLETLARTGRALLTVRIELYDEHDTHAATVNVEWFVARERGNAESKVEPADPSRLGTV
jgi:acyl-coenzyme A thioesterase PaaI-like protein